MTAQLVQVRLELGHRANIRDKVTDDGFTHNWSVFVRGRDGCNIQEFVEKVIFYLHADFPKPKRVLKNPPYQVSECGYAGFFMPIDVYFKNKEEPKLLSFEYDLFLHMEGPPVNHIRLEKLTFQNPTEDFRRKLLKGGGVEVTRDGESNMVLAEATRDGESNMVLAEATRDGESNMVIAEAQSTVPDSPKPGRPRLSDITAGPAARKLTPAVRPQHQYSSTSRECSPDSTSDSHKRQKLDKPIRL